MYTIKYTIKQPRFLVGIARPSVLARAFEQFTDAATKTHGATARAPACRQAPDALSRLPMSRGPPAPALSGSSLSPGFRPGLPEADVTMTQHKLELPNPVQIREEINAAIPETLPARRAGRER